MARFIMLRSVDSDSWAVLENTPNGPQLTRWRIRRQEYVNTYVLGDLADDGEDFGLSLTGIYQTPEAALEALESRLAADGD